MKQNDYVRITKLTATINPLAPTPDKADYKPGQDNGAVSLPVDYTMTGTLLRDIVEGDRIDLLRDKRNGVVIDGRMTSTTIMKIEGNLVYTRNSVYQIEPV